LSFHEINPDVLLSKVDSRQLSEWYAFYRINPWGTYRQDINAAVVAKATVDSHIPNTTTLEDFIVKFREPEEIEPPSEKELQDKLMTMLGRGKRK